MGDGDGDGDGMARRHGGVAASALHPSSLRRLLARAEGMLWADGKGSSESLALTFESATELSRDAPDNGGTTAWKGATSELIAAFAAHRAVLDRPGSTPRYFHR